MVNTGLASFVRQMEDAFRRHDRAAAAKADEHVNVACLQAFFAALARDDFDAAFALLGNDIEYSVFAAGPIPLQMSGRGRLEVQTGIRNNFSALTFDSVDVDTLVAQGDVIVVIARQIGRWLASEVPFDERVVLRYGFRDGKLISYRGWILPSAP